MFATFSFFAFFVALCLFTAEPAPQMAASAPVEDDLLTLEKLLTEAEALTARPVPAVAAAGTAPIAVAVVKVEAAAYAKMTSEQLWKECIKATPRIVWRNAYGKGRHMRKEEMVNALS